VLEWRQRWCSQWGLAMERFEDTDMKDVVDTHALEAVGGRRCRRRVPGPRTAWCSAMRAFPKRPVLMVLTTSFRSSKSRKRGEYIYDKFHACF
jgi:hypothetical protein